VCTLTYPQEKKKKKLQSIGHLEGVYEEAMGDLELAQPCSKRSGQGEKGDTGNGVSFL